MKILMVAQFATPIIGGEEQHITNLSAELIRCQHEVAIATIQHPGQAEFEVIEGMRIYRLQGTIGRFSQFYSDDGRRHAPPFPDPELASGIRRVMEVERPDVVHAHNWLAYSYLPIASRSKVGLVVTLHDYSMRCAIKRFMYHGSPCSGPGVRKCLECAGIHYGQIKGKATYLSNQAMASWERKAVDMFLAVSQVTAEKNGLVGSGLPYRVIPNFVPDELGFEENGHAALFDQLPEDGFLLFAGDLSCEKGLNVLLEAYQGLTNAPPLVLIGRKTSDTPAELPTNVRAMGPWPHSALMQAWKRSSIALAPSVWNEPFGMVVIEAMSAGRPVIASEIGGIPDIVTHGESGILVPPGDVESLRQAIELLLENPEMRQKMGNAAERRSAQFRSSTVVPRIEAVYRSVINGKGQ